MEETPKYQVWLKGLAVSPEPDTYYASKKEAEKAMERISQEYPQLAALGLEVRPD
jgi:3'-phosphoadenosine 5'-phosphosulfate sulfotransferase